MACALAIVAAESTVALAITLMEGFVVLAVLAAASLAGGWVIALLGLGDAPRADRLILGGGVGVGLSAIVVFAVARAGAWGRPAAIVIAVVLAIAAAGRVVVELRRNGGPTERGQTSGGLPDKSSPFLRWAPSLWLLVGPFLGITILGACLPPGILWQEEAGGYDVLEYHLAVPKIWHEAGAVRFLGNNVYSNFPLVGQMLSMWMMGLHGDPIEAAFMAHFVNVFLGALFVAAAWLFGSQFSPRAGLIAGVLAGCTPWLVYLSAIAYDESGVLALGMCSAAAVGKVHSDPARARRWALLAGLLVGLACGFKYTAVALIALPWAVLLASASGSWKRAAEALALYTLAAVAAFSPWMIRNAVNTGNPVFPLASGLFPARTDVWDAELQERWDHAHGRGSDAFAAAPTVAGLWQRTLGEPRIGIVTVLMAGCAIVLIRDRRTWAGVTVLAVQAAVWLLATHLFARFAVFGVIPLIALAARTVDAYPHRLWRAAVVALLVVGTGLNLYRVGRLYYDHTRLGTTREPIDAYGQTAWFTEGQWPGTDHFGAINALPTDSRVMLVGEARTFYLRRPFEYATVFNRHPLARAARRDPSGPALLDWLQKRGTTHLLAHWTEIGRLQATYGLDTEINAALFERLEQAGLSETPTTSFYSAGATSAYATLWKIPQPVHEGTRDE